MGRTKKVLYILSWLPVIAVKLVLILLGLIAVPVAIGWYGPVSTHWPKLFWIFGNSENVPAWWYRAAAGKPLIRHMPAFWWYAVRNPTSNQRYWFKDRPANYSGNWATNAMEAADLIAAGITEAHRWAYNGLFAGYRKVWLNGQDTYSEFWIGWKLGSSVPGLGFGMQLRLKRKIGT